MTEKLMMYLEYPFVRYALIVGVLIALCSSLLGVTLVLKRFSFIGDGLSHVAFGAMSIAAVFNISNDMLLVLPVTVISAVLLLRTGQNTKIKGDAAIAMISVGALAFGYLIMNVFSTSSNLSGDVCSTLFGSTSILTLTKREVAICTALSVAVVVIFVLLYNLTTGCVRARTKERVAPGRLERLDDDGRARAVELLTRANMLGVFSPRTRASAWNGITIADINEASLCE